MMNLSKIKRGIKQSLKLVMITVLSALLYSQPCVSKINSVRVGQGIGNVRVVLDSDSSFNYRVFTLGDPYRLVVDVYKQDVAAKLATNIGRNNLISKVRVGELENGKRFVFDLQKPVAVDKISFLRPQSGFDWRFFIDTSITSDRAFNAKIGEKNAYSNLKGEVIQSSNHAKKEPVKENKSSSARVIVLDPGHGGKDPGAIGYSGVYEKNITLAMGKELKSVLEKAGYKVHLTRSGDTFINLRERYRIARRQSADLFISIHADSARNKSATGLSVYTLSEKASDHEAAALAERENKADLIGGMDLNNEDKELTSIFISLSQNMTRKNSSDFAEYLQDEMAKTVKLVTNAHRFAGFAVLKAPDIPSVLVELGYLSNRNEEKLLKQEAYRKKLAQATLRAVNKYFETPRD